MAYGIVAVSECFKICVKMYTAELQGDPSVDQWMAEDFQDLAGCSWEDVIAEAVAAVEKIRQTPTTELGGLYDFLADDAKELFAEIDKMTAGEPHALKTGYEWNEDDAELIFAAASEVAAAFDYKVVEPQATGQDMDDTVYKPAPGYVGMPVLAPIGSHLRPRATETMSQA